MIVLVLFISHDANSLDLAHVHPSICKQSNYWLQFDFSLLDFSAHKHALFVDRMPKASI